ncbi:hypothetical protein MKW94_029739 [Papaver nudicaule]|uniref:Major facilitator superfamily (MFS) profile domain-containing protein n=1 Tax=Papaver nudicaule TaxID=74823 RepID=A0AA41VCT3_PAPNU|nr:hypothetical protein [Papaver nudicaule]
MLMRHKHVMGKSTQLPTVGMKSNNKQKNKMSFIFLGICIIGGNSGFLIGYIIGIFGGVIFTPEYGKSIYPDTYKDTEVSGYNHYCSLYFMAISLVPGSLYCLSFFALISINIECSRLETRKHMIVAGGSLFMGSVVSALATNIVMFVIGPNLLGLGFGLLNYQGAQRYMSEMAPTQNNHLGFLNIAFKMLIAIGILVANLVNYSTYSIKDEWGWRASFGVAVIPAAIISIGSFLLPDTPISMVKHGKLDDAKRLLQRLHETTNDISMQYNDLITAKEAFKSALGFKMRTLSQTQNTPYLLMAIALPLLQQLTGINVMVIYSPFLFKALAFRTDATLLYTSIIGGVNVAATIIGIVTVSRGRRRFHIIAGGVQMFVGQIMVGTLVLIKLVGATGLGDVYDYLIVVAICICVSGFAWWWGPLGRVFFSNDDILLLFPLEIRPYGQNLAVGLHWIFSSFMAVVFPLMLCHLQFGVFYLFAFFVMIMTLFAYYLVPETNGILLEDDVSQVWKQHWFWRRYFFDPSSLMV